ncbi:MAG: DUF4325 domain-containing protein [Candidatus Aureabacteria bacterium]|nr:DUF4325 domain-containing protein [Candidatus Auribacterota bacterium]
MKAKDLILSMLEKKGEVRASDIIREIGFSRAYINRFFQELRDEGKILLIGKANKAKYILATEKRMISAREEVKKLKLILSNKDLAEDKVLKDIKKRSGIFLRLSKNVSNIVDYVFTEILNNAIEHSFSEKINIVIEKDKTHVRFNIVDAGVGIFKNIMKKKDLKSIMDAVQDLLKGKQTTAPLEHSGEGIFFTSKCADVFVIKSSEKKIVFNNLLDDIFLSDIKTIKGTKINFSISLDSKQSLDKVFKEYTNPDTLDFDKTKVVVKLYKIGTDFISRSQARRILSGLEKFSKIILDFSDVETVGQGFADEVFRVWKNRYPHKEVYSENANENILFMIERV